MVFIWSNIDANLIICTLLAEDSLSMTEQLKDSRVAFECLYQVFLLSHS